MKEQILIEVQEMAINSTFNVSESSSKQPTTNSNLPASKYIPKHRTRPRSNGVPFVDVWNRLKGTTKKDKGFQTDFLE